MEYYNADLHIHSPYSIAVSKAMNLETMVDNCRKKGLKILATGDILQPDWLKYMKNNLEKKNGDTFFYKELYLVSFLQGLLDLIRKLNSSFWIFYFYYFFFL